ncbi:hypothetical protein Tco_1157398 [Tanacetum coccineum]
MFWLQSSDKNSEEPSTSNTPVKIEIPSELPKEMFCDSEKKNEDYVGTCNKCLELEAELVKKNDVYNELSKRCSNLEKHYISIEVAMQLNQEIFQKDKSCVNQNALEIQEYFEQNDLKAQLQAKDTHSVAKLLSENELLHKEIKHLKKIYKYQFDSIKKTCASSKEHGDSLIIQLNSKSMENADLKGQIQEKTCPSLTKPSEILGAITPKNKDKKVRFAGPVTSLNNTQKQVDSHKPKDSNQPLLHSTGVICSTGASESKPTGNKEQ